LFEKDKILYGDIEYSEIPEDYWINRYMMFVNVGKFCLEKTKKYWEEEDTLYEQNKISEEEWKEIQGL
jgi:hypothetical protein